MKPRRHIGQHRCDMLVVATLLAALTVAPAHAAGLTCSLAATSLVFGIYAPASTVADDVTATITVSCTATGTSSVSLQGAISLTSVSSSQSRQLVDATSTLRYHTYLNPGRTTFWGNGSGLGRTEPVSGVVGPTTPFQQAFTVYGRIPARQSSARVGTYLDQITATLNY
jgi:spore coat protein U-like protein